MLTFSILDEVQTSILYKEQMTRDFPPCELKSLNAIVNMMRRDEYDVLSASKDGVPVAYALLYRPKGETVVLLDYLAVAPQYRAQGIGTELVRKLRGYYAEEAEALLIECERPKTAPDEAEARRRIRFYQRAGAEMTTVRVWLFDVEYSIMVLACHEHMPQYDWAQMILQLYRKMMPLELFEQNVKLIQA